MLPSLNDNKLVRLHKIVKEAGEQSWSWELPKIHLISDLQSLHQERSFMVFDLIPSSHQSGSIKKSDLPCLGVI